MSLINFEREICEEYKDVYEDICSDSLKESVERHNDLDLIRISSTSPAPQKWMLLHYIGLNLKKEEKSCIQFLITLYERELYREKNIDKKFYFVLGHLWEKLDKNSTWFNKIVNISSDFIVNYRYVLNQKEDITSYTQKICKNYSKLNEYEKCIDACLKEEKYQNNEELLLLLGHIYLKNDIHPQYSDRLDKAISFFEKNQLDNSTKKALAAALFKKCDYEKAYNLKEYLTWQLSYYYENEGKNIKKAIENCDNCIEHNNYLYYPFPEDFLDFYFNLLEKYYTQEFKIECCKLAKAYRHKNYEKAIKLYSLVPTYTEIARIYKNDMIGDWEKMTRENIEKALENNEVDVYFFKGKLIKEGVVYNSDINEIYILINNNANKNIVNSSEVNYELLKILRSFYTDDNYHKILQEIYSLLLSGNNYDFYYTTYLVGESFLRGYGIDKDLKQAYEYLSKARSYDNNNIYEMKNIKSMLKECCQKEYLSHKLQNLIDSQADKLCDGVYLQICNLLKELYQKETQSEESDEEESDDSDY